MLLSLTVLTALCFYCTLVATNLKQEFAPLENLSLSEFVRSNIGRGSSVMGAICEVSILGASIGGCAVYLNLTGQILAQVYCQIPPYLYR